jgi:hypothetical protein
MPILWSMACPKAWSDLETRAHEGWEWFENIRHAMTQHHFKDINLWRSSSLERIQTMLPHRVIVTCVDLLFSFKIRNISTLIIAPWPDTLVNQGQDMVREKTDTIRQTVVVSLKVARAKFPINQAAGQSPNLNHQRKTDRQ